MYSHPQASSKGHNQAKTSKQLLIRVQCNRRRWPHAACCVRGGKEPVLSYLASPCKTCCRFLIAVCGPPRNRAGGARFSGGKPKPLRYKINTRDVPVETPVSPRSLQGVRRCTPLLPNTPPCFQPVPTRYWCGRRHETKGTRRQRSLSYRVVVAEGKGHGNARINASTSTVTAVRMYKGRTSSTDMDYSILNRPRAL